MQCKESKLANCNSCGAEWQPPAGIRSAPCPVCGERKGWVKQYCDACPKLLVQEMEYTAIGERVLSCITSYFDAKLFGSQFDYDNITLLDYYIVRVVEEERRALESEAPTESQPAGKDVAYGVRGGN